MSKPVLCFEVSLNGKVLFRAGGENLVSQFASVAHGGHIKQPRFRVHGLNHPEEKLYEEVYWAQETDLNVGDALTVRVIEDTPDQFTVGSYFGSRTVPLSEQEHYCTFCGKSARDVGMLWHPRANICHECLRRYQPEK